MSCNNKSMVKINHQGNQWNEWITGVLVFICSPSFLPFDKALRNSILLHCIQKSHDNAKEKTRMFDIRRFCLVFMQVGLPRLSTYVRHTLFTTVHKPGACKLQPTYVVLLTYVFSALQSDFSEFER